MPQKQRRRPRSISVLQGIFQCFHGNGEGHGSSFDQIQGATVTRIQGNPSSQQPGFTPASDITPCSSIPGIIDDVSGVISQLYLSQQSQTSNMLFSDLLGGLSSLSGLQQHQAAHPLARSRTALVAMEGDDRNNGNVDDRSVESDSAVTTGGAALVQRVLSETSGVLTSRSLLKGAGSLGGSLDVTSASNPPGLDLTPLQLQRLIEMQMTQMQLSEQPGDAPYVGGLVRNRQPPRPASAREHYHSDMGAQAGQQPDGAVHGVVKTATTTATGFAAGSSLHTNTCLAPSAASKADPADRSVMQPDKSHARTAVTVGGYNKPATQPPPSPHPVTQQKASMQTKQPCVTPIIASSKARRSDALAAVHGPVPRVFAGMKRGAHSPPSPGPHYDPLSAYLGPPFPIKPLQAQVSIDAQDKERQLASTVGSDTDSFFSVASDGGQDSEGFKAGYGRKTRGQTLSTSGRWQGALDSQLARVFSAGRSPRRSVSPLSPYSAGKKWSQLLQHGTAQGQSPRRLEAPLSPISACRDSSDLFATAPELPLVLPAASGMHSLWNSFGGCGYDAEYESYDSDPLDDIFGSQTISEGFQWHGDNGAAATRRPRPEFEQTMPEIGAHPHEAWSEIDTTMPEIPSHARQLGRENSRRHFDPRQPTAGRRMQSSIVGADSFRDRGTCARHTPGPGDIRMPPPKRHNVRPLHPPCSTAGSRVRRQHQGALADEDFCANSNPAAPVTALTNDPRHVPQSSLPLQRGVSHEQSLASPVQRMRQQDLGTRAASNSGQEVHPKATGTDVVVEYSTGTDVVVEYSTAEKGGGPSSGRSKNADVGQNGKLLGWNNLESNQGQVGQGVSSKGGSTSNTVSSRKKSIGVSQKSIGVSQKSIGVSQRKLDASDSNEISSQRMGSSTLSKAASSTRKVVQGSNKVDASFNNGCASSKNGVLSSPASKAAAYSSHGLRLHQKTSIGQQTSNVDPPREASETSSEQAGDGDGDGDGERQASGLRDASAQGWQSSTMQQKQQKQRSRSAATPPTDKRTSSVNGKAAADVSASAVQKRPEEVAREKVVHKQASIVEQSGEVASEQASTGSGGSVPRRQRSGVAEQTRQVAARAGHPRIFSSRMQPRHRQVGSRDVVATGAPFRDGVSFQSRRERPRRGGWTPPPDEGVRDLDMQIQEAIGMISERSRAQKRHVGRGESLVGGQRAGGAGRTQTRAVV